jgi:NADH-quinone oxidoreductase subunit L
MKAIIVNRFGDFGIYLFIILIFYFTKSLDFSVIFNLCFLLVEENLVLYGFLINKINIICFCLFLGAIGKSAQLGLHT